MKSLNFFVINGFVAFFQLTLTLQKYFIGFSALQKHFYQYKILSI